MIFSHTLENLLETCERPVFPHVMGAPNSLPETCYPDSLKLDTIWTLEVQTNVLPVFAPVSGTVLQWTRVNLCKLSSRCHNLWHWIPRCEHPTLKKTIRKTNRKLVNFAHAIKRNME